MRCAIVACIVVAAAATAAAPFGASAQTSGGAPPRSAADATADAPSVKRLEELLAVVNSGDPSALRAYLKANSINARTNSWDSNLLPLLLDLYRLSRGFDLVRVATVGRQQIQPQLQGYTVGILRNKTTGDEQAIAVEVETQPPHRITGLPLLHPSLVATMVRPVSSTTFSEQAQLQEIGAWLKRLADADIFAGAVVIARDSQPVFSQAYGYADREKKIPNTLTTPFLLGSMVKLFTGLAIGQLVEQGKLSYDDPLSKFIPGYPDAESAKQIQVKHLLSHTSGLTTGFEGDAYYKSLDRLNTVQALVDTGDRERPKFEPGTKWAYSNFGYVLLGRIVEIVSGEDYYDYMQKNVLARAGMVNSSFPLLPRNGVAVVPMAYPYDVSFNGERLEYVNKLGADFRRGGPSCCGVASALDLIALENALQAGRVVKPETFRLHSSPKPELAASLYGYGFTAGLRNVNNHLLIGHGGNAFGQCTEFGALTGTPYTIVVLSNLTIGTCNTVTRKIMQVLTSSDAQTPQRPPQPGALATPAGRAVSEWLDAYNSADSTKLRAYYDRYQLVRSMSVQLDQRRQTGGFDLVSIGKSTPRYIEFVVKARATGMQAFGVVELNAEGTPGLKQSALMVIPEGTTPAAFTVDSARRASVIDRAVENLNNEYVFSDVAQKMATEVRARLHRGEYNDVTNAITFAARLTEDFRAVSHDKHLRVNFSAGGTPAAPPPATAPSGPPSCGFTAALEPNGNVGVIKFNGFANLTVECGGAVTRAFDLVADADAMIFDLRENGGGDAGMVAFISSYLFDERTHLNDVMSRKRDESGRLILPDQFWPHESWTNPVPGRKYGGKKPVYVLTSGVTFSAAEEFSYNLQALKRATIVGEQTGGGAHPTRSAKIDDQFSIGVPFARSVNPITRTNWEGTGVTPDVRVPAAKALETAKSLIAKKAD